MWPGHNTKLDLILEHLKINVPVPVKQPHSFNLGLPIPQTLNTSEVNSEPAGTLEKQLNFLQDFIDLLH